MKFSNFIAASSLLFLTAAKPLESILQKGGVLARSLHAYAKTQNNVKRSVISDILDDIKNMAECGSCTALLGVLQILAHTGNDAFVDVITKVCQIANVEDSDVCSGAIGLEGPILAHNLRVMDVNSKTGKLFCLTVFGLCQWPDVDTSFQVPGLTAKPAAAKPRPAPSGQTPLKVVHISDIHVDLSYQEGASYNCTKNICCRPYTAVDMPGNTSAPAGPYGNAKCDTPAKLEDSMYAAINALVPDRSFTIFTGDVVEGAVWLVNETEVTHDLNDAFGRMQSQIGMTYGVVGNHDAAPVNSFPPTSVETTMTTQWVYDIVSSSWNGWIGATAAKNVANNSGCYSTVNAKTGVKIISVNTNFWYKQNFWLYEKTMASDPSGILAWLVSELQEAETAGQRVWLMGHMPMGASDAFHDQSYYFDQIIQRYEGTIAAVFYGHTHKDEFEISYSDYKAQSASTACMVSYIAPALTPTSGHPTFRVYSVDPVTFAVLDYTTYMANMSNPAFQTTGPVWTEYYSVKQTYGSLLGVTDPAAELTPAFWHNLTALFETNDAVFQDFVSRKSRGTDNSTCTGDCKTGEICQLRAGQSQFNCAVVKPGIHFKKRDEGDVGAHAAEHRHVGECEGSQAVGIMSAMTSEDGLKALRSALVEVVGDGFLNATVSSR